MINSSNLFKLKILLILIIGFSLISAVSAEDAADDVNDDVLTENSEISDVEVGTDELKPDKTTGSFEDLSNEINNTPEGETLILDKDYKYFDSDNKSNKGVVIAKPMTIDGAGHTIYGSCLSRIFNITADNVIIRNLTFVGGCAVGRYDDIPVGGGAIYWGGDNGYIENCQFINNTASGIEDDPYDKEYEYVDEKTGIHYYTYISRPMGARTNEGGAIVWRGDNGTVSKCLFRHNSLDYPNGGGAIFWRGTNGKVLDSEFYDNWAFVGSAIYWKGLNGFIDSSIFINGGIGDSGIFWYSQSGNITNSILLSDNGRSVLNLYEGNLSADNNWWGYTLSNFKDIKQLLKLNSFYILNLSSNKNFVLKGDKFTIYGDLGLLKNAEGIVKYPFNLTLDFYLSDGGLVHLVDGTFNYTFTAKNNGFVNLSLKANNIIVKVIPKTKFLYNENIIAYYGSNVVYKIRVFGENGKLAKNQKVKFTINNKVKYINTDSNAYVYLNFKKLGKYTIKAEYANLKATNTVNIKSTLITKDLTKKYNKVAQYSIKVLNSKGKAYSNQLVKIVFKGKYYKFKTNYKGYVIFNIPKYLKIGCHTIKVSANGLTNTNTIKVKK